MSTNNQIYYEGNVGIGTTDPSEKLDVNGTLKLSSQMALALAAGGGKGSFGAPADKHPLRLFESWGWNFTLQNDNNSGFRVGPANAENGASTNFFTVQGNTGNVGIGTTSPTRDLDVNGTIGATGDLQLQKAHKGNDANSWKQNIAFYDEVNRIGASITGMREQWDGAPMALSLNTGGVGTVHERVRIKSNGNVGIGTTNPSQKLEVAGNVKIGTGRCALEIKNGRNEDITFKSNNGWMRFYSRYEVSFWTNGRAENDDSPQMKVDLNGNIHCQGSLHQNSDGRLKKDIQPISGALDKVSGLRGVNYHWKDGSRGTEEQLGLIAQEVEAVLPGVVSTDNNGIKSIAYSNLTAVLIEAVKELKNEVLELRSQVQVAV